MNEEEFLKVRRCFRLVLGIVIALFVIYFVSLAFITIEQATEYLGWMRWFAVFLGVISGAQIMKRRTMRYRNFEKQYEFEQFLKNKENAKASRA